ncbi:MAG: hypothetical protein Kow0099_07490 [Candidatus Abyssubacteria bacterium]
MRKFTEIKRHVNKPTERYECDLIKKDDNRAVLRYVSDREFESEHLGITFPPGCTTIALYQKDVPYVFWGIFSPENTLLGCLVHICKDLSISEHSLSYLDMLLDIWVYPDGTYEILDIDEVDECLRTGRLTHKDKEYIEEAKDTALRDFPEKAETAKRIAAKHGAQNAT